MSEATPYSQYWQEAVESALEEAGLTATTQQIDSIADAMEGAHDCYGMAFGLDVADGNLRATHENENRALQRKLDNERSKVTCRVCGGSGDDLTPTLGHVGISQCWKCRGEGRHLP